MNNLNWTVVKSSSLSSIAYDDSSRSLFIKFYQSGTYKYFDVPSNIYQGLLNAPSHEQYHASFIRNTFKSTKL